MAILTRLSKDLIQHAKSIIAQDLRDPNSVTWNSTSIEEKDEYRRYVVRIDYTATNGFGGRVRDEALVGLRLTDDGAKYSTYMPYVQTRDYDQTVIDSCVKLMKDAIGWGEKPEEETD